MSLVIIVPKSEVEQVREALEAAGYGPGNLGVPMRGRTILGEDSDVEEATHYGSHWWASRRELKPISDLIIRLSPTARIVANVSEQEAAEIGCESSSLSGFELADAQSGERVFVQIDAALVDDWNRGLNMLSAEARGRYTIRIDHPTDLTARPLLRFRTEDEIEINAEGRDNRVKQVLAALFDAGRITQAERRPILDVVNAKGVTVKVLSLLPPIKVWPRLTPRQAREAGYLRSSISEARG